MNYKIFCSLIFVVFSTLSIAESTHPETQTLLPNTLKICQNQKQMIEGVISKDSLDPQLKHSTLAIDFVKYICEAVEPLAAVQIPMLIDFTKTGYISDLISYHSHEIGFDGDILYVLVHMCRNSENRVLDGIHLICNELDRRVEALKVPLTYSEVLVSDLYSIFDPEKDHKARSIIAILTDTSKDYSITFHTGPLALCMGGLVVHRSSSEAYFPEESDRIRFKTRTHYNKNTLLYSHPDVDDQSFEGETKIVHSLKDKFVQALWDDKVITVGNMPKTSQSNAYPQDSINDLILNIQEYKNPKNIPEYWFPWDNYDFNKKLMKSIEYGISFSIHHKATNLQPSAPHSLISTKENLYKLVHWYKHVILRYPENVKGILKILASSEGGLNFDGAYAAKQILKASDASHSDYLHDFENLYLFVKFGLASELISAIIEQVKNPASLIESFLEDYVKSMGDDVGHVKTFKVLLEASHSILTKEAYDRLVDTRTFYGLFKIIKCDETTFKGCPTLLEDLKYYYLNSEQEVKDILEVAMNAFLRQTSNLRLNSAENGKDISCAPYFIYDDKEKSVQGVFFSDYKDALGCGIVVSFSETMTKEFWGVFVHEMAHKAFHVVYKNDANPYNDKDSKDLYKTMMDKIVSPLLGICDEHIFVKIARRYLSTFMYGVNNIRYDLARLPCLYPVEHYDLENVVRYYQHIATDGIYAADQVFEGMREFHKDHFLKRAAKAGFLLKGRSE